MIKSFGDKTTEAIYHGKRHLGRLPPQIVKTAVRKLDIINAAGNLLDLRVPPGNRLEALKGNLTGFHSIRINEQWRVIFRWSEPHAYEVKVVDYH